MLRSAFCIVGAIAWLAPTEALFNLELHRAFRASAAEVAPAANSEDSAPVCENKKLTLEHVRSHKHWCSGLSFTVRQKERTIVS